MTTRDNQRPADPTDGNDITTLTYRQQHDHNTPDAPNTATTQPHPPRHPHDTALTDISAGPKPSTPRLAAYIRHVVDTAPTPTPAQLERLAGLLRDLRNPSESS